MKIIIIGGVTAGMSAVSKIMGGGRAEVVVYEKAAICSWGTCGLPYYLANRDADIRQAVAAMKEKLQTLGVTARCRHEVMSVQFGQKQVTVQNLDNGQVFTDHYDKLVIAAGSRCFIPDVPGVQKVGVQTLKTVEDVIFLREFTKTPFVRDVTIIGGSFAGLELAKAFLKMGRGVRIIEKGDQLLPAFDPEVSAMIGRELEEKGVKIHLRETLKGFSGGTFIEKTETSRGSYDTDLAMMAMGVAPNTGFLAGSGIAMTPEGTVLINKSMETNLPDVYAAGDCTETSGGALRTSSLKMADFEIARTGLTEREAAGTGRFIKTALVTADDRPGICPNASQITVKMVYDGRDGRILGAQAWGKKHVISRINMFAVAIEAGMTPDELAGVDFSYSSASSSIWDPVQVVCHDAGPPGTKIRL